MAQGRRRNQTSTPRESPSSSQPAPSKEEGGFCPGALWLEVARQGLLRLASRGSACGQVLGRGRGFSSGVCCPGLQPFGHPPRTTGKGNVGFLRNALPWKRLAAPATSPLSRDLQDIQGQGWMSIPGQFQALLGAAGTLTASSPPCCCAVTIPFPIPISGSSQGGFSTGAALALTNPSCKPSAQPSRGHG